jgi:hypothetical protein
MKTHAIALCGGSESNWTRRVDVYLPLKSILTPPPPIKPNAKTIAAMKAARAGRVKRFKSFKEFLRAQRKTEPR